MSLRSSGRFPAVLLFVHQADAYLTPRIPLVRDLSPKYVKLSANTYGPPVSPMCSNLQNSSLPPGSQIVIGTSTVV